MTMSIGPLQVAVELEQGFNRKEAKELLEDLQTQLPKMDSGSDARMIISMIIGNLSGLLREKT